MYFDLVIRVYHHSEHIRVVSQFYKVKMMRKKHYMHNWSLPSKSCQKVEKGREKCLGNASGQTIWVRQVIGALGYREHNDRGKGLLKFA